LGKYWLTFIRIPSLESCKPLHKEIHIWLSAKQAQTTILGCNTKVSTTASQNPIPLQYRLTIGLLILTLQPDEGCTVIAKPTRKTKIKVELKLALFWLPSHIGYILHQRKGTAPIP
jgi:hypothetical protein